MSSQKQIDANRENAQHSTGPATDSGRARAALNSTVHGFTGQTLVVPEAEKPHYEAFVLEMHREFTPSTPESRELLQNYIDLRWSIQQITVQQQNILSLQNIITAQHLASGDIAAMDAALEAGIRRLKTLSTYEQRRRRAASDTLDHFKLVEKDHYELVEEQLESAAEMHMAHAALGKSWDPREFGFVCSISEIEEFIKSGAAENELPQPELQPEPAPPAGI